MNSLDMTSDEVKVFINTTRKTYINKHASPLMNQIFERYEQLLGRNLKELKRVLNSHYYPDPSMYVDSPQPPWIAGSFERLVFLILTMETANASLDRTMLFPRHSASRFLSNRLDILSGDLRRWFNTHRHGTCMNIERTVYHQLKKHNELVIDNDTLATIDRMARETCAEFERLVGEIATTMTN
jgi:hypothetical protein